MFHLLILAIIETLYIDIQIFVYLNDGKTIIFGKASFYHSFHCKIVDSMPKTIVPGMERSSPERETAQRRATFSDGMGRFNTF